MSSALEDNKLRLIHIVETNQYRNEDGIAFVDVKGKEQRDSTNLMRLFRACQKDKRF